MNSVYKNILTSISEGEKLLAVLIDPDKMERQDVSKFMEKVNASRVSHVFVGGSEVAKDVTEQIVLEIKTWTSLPIILFPGDVKQITSEADALLFLSLISGRNPDYLIGKHIEAASSLQNSNLEVIPTGYILIENGKETSVQRVSKTQPLSRNNVPLIVQTAKAGELLGMRMVYLEAGSGASHPVNSEIINQVKKTLSVPIIVGGGIKNISALKSAFSSGADMVVIGTAFEENEALFNALSQEKL